MAKRVLVTGGAGFIGSNIVEGLLESGFEVVALDNMSLGTKDYWGEFSERFGDRFTGVEGDVKDYDLLERVASDVDFVVHMAAASSLPMFVPDPREGVEVNVLGFLNVLELARRHDNIGKVIYASTSSIYGAFVPPHREDLPVFPRMFYEYSMYAREHAARIYNDLHGVKTFGLRFFSIYGPREQHKGKFANIVTQFLWLMRKGDRPVIFGDGSQTRDFTFVKDVVEVVKRIIQDSKLELEVFNVGTGVETTFNEVVKLLNDILGTDIEPVYRENPIKNYVYRTQADTRKLEKLLGYKPNTPLIDGLKFIKEYYSDIDI